MKKLSNHHSWSILYLSVTLLLVVIISVISVTFARPWCASSQGANRRNWRLPPPPLPPRSSKNNSPFRQQFYRPASPTGPPLPGRPTITLFQHENHNGFRYEQTVGNRCYNLPNVINDQASSVNTYNRCVKVCRDKDCKACKKLYRGSPGHFRLSEIGLDDAITSITACGEVYDSF